MTATPTVTYVRSLPPGMPRLTSVKDALDEISDFQERACLPEPTIAMKKDSIFLPTQIIATFALGKEPENVL